VSTAVPAGRLGNGAGLIVSSRAGLPERISVFERPPLGGWDVYDGPIVVLVHGSLDRASSFNRTVFRLPDLAVVVYDRRGYQGSRTAGLAASLRTHVEDLLAITRVFDRLPADGAARTREPPKVSAVGHSVGGTIVFGAAIAAPGLFASVGAYEPPMPWLGFRRPRRDPGRDDVGRTARRPPDPGEEAERFFRRMAGDAAWERLGERQQQERCADGPALVADLRSISGPAPYDVTALRTPAIVAAGGQKSAPHHLMTADWLAAHVALVRRTELPEASHGAHLSHPGAFATMVREVVALGAPGAAGRG
jgi:pimeloyl-ACP methyl ester carboxylesterase